MITRFAPSPTGYLHKGHAYAAWFAHEMAAHDSMRLRIDDLDQMRTKPEFERAILRDLEWMGIGWKGAMLRQSTRHSHYREAIQQIQDRGLLYPCFCTRRMIKQNATAIQTAPHHDLYPPYPGTCRNLDPARARDLIAAGTPHALRMDSVKALAQIGDQFFYELGVGQIKVRLPEGADPILARKDIGAAYHLAVVVDDAAQEIECITRGVDLLPATHLHRILQVLLQLSEPVWKHHRLIYGDDGKRLAKRQQSASLLELQARGIRADALMAEFESS
ncbi:MAG: tRNA glutamyl-Q(34) synthetase GluQRS, partial [Pseudomonadota bacterium]